MSEIKKALEYRIEQCGNVYFDEVTRSGLCDFGEQVPTDFTKPLTNSRGQCWAIGNSFRFDKERRDRQRQNELYPQGTPMTPTRALYASSEWTTQAATTKTGSY